MLIIKILRCNLWYQSQYEKIEKHGPNFKFFKSFTKSREVVGLKLIQLEQQKTKFASIILAKNLKLVLFRNIKRKWHAWDWKYIICIVKFQRQKLPNFTWKFCISRAPSPHRINFWVYFLIQYIHIKRIFKTLSHFFLVFCGFWFIAKSYRSITF